MKFAYIDDSGYVTSFLESDTIQEGGIEIEVIPSRPEDDNGWLKYHLESETWVDSRSQEEINQLLKDSVLSKRANLLCMTDWTQLPDAPSQNKEAWADYRQKLRDITEQDGYPTVVSWPVKPNFG